MEPKPEKRPVNLSEVHRFLDDRWMSKGMEKTNETAKEEEGLCPSMYSFHSSPEEKNKLLYTLKEYGLETTVDRGAKKDRIRQWIQNSVIEECDEEEPAEDDIDEDRIKIIDNENGPIGEMVEYRGPISESKIKINGHRKEQHGHHRRERRPTKEPQVYKPPVDPRIPLQMQINSVKDTNSAFQSKNSNSQTSSESALSSSDSSNFTIKNVEPSKSGSLKEVRFDMTPKTREEFIQSKSLIYNESTRHHHRHTNGKMHRK